MRTDTSQEEIHEARAQYIIDTVRSADDLLIVEQSGRAAAVIISLEEYRRFAAWRKERAERRAWVLERDPHRQMTAEQWQAQFGALDRIAERFNGATFFTTGLDAHARTGYAPGAGQRRRGSGHHVGLR